MNVALRRYRLLATAGVVLACLALAPGSSAQDDLRRVEVVAVQGIIDSVVERSITTAIRVAGREGAEAVVLQVDSAGGIGRGRPDRLSRVLRESPVPVITWVGPPGARAANSAAAVVTSSHVAAISPGSALGPATALDLRERGTAAGSLKVPSAIRDRALSAEEAEEQGLVQMVALQLPDVLRKVDGRVVRAGGRELTLHTNPDGLRVRFRKQDLLGRVGHAASQPSLAYLLILLGLVGIVFELFHPSTGPGGVAAVVSLGLGLFGFVTLRGSWLGLALLVAGVAAFCVDLRLESLGLFTLLGVAGLVAGSLLLFPAPLLRVSPWVLALGISGMVAFLLGAMTRVLRDLRAIARGELEVTDPHPH
ncbi:MAG TPA: hypothetical protein VNE62_05110 [Actinomycetota bacterium]|nr:hypothetical protein [Actinomycetota bacterium]